MHNLYGALRWWRVPPVLWLCPCFTRRSEFRPQTVERCRALVLQYVFVLVVSGIAQLATYEAGVRHASYVKVRALLPLTLSARRLGRGELKKYTPRARATRGAVDSSRTR